MTSAVQSFAVDTFRPMLRVVLELLEKAAAHAESQHIEVEVLLEAKLAPDMFPLSAQVQLACYHARDAMLRLTGNGKEELPKGKESLANLQSRIQTTLERLSATNLNGADERRIEIQVDATRVFEMSGLEYLRDWAIPHFYFHLVTAYDILRSSGVTIGKRDYMSPIGRYLRRG